MLPYIKFLLTKYSCTFLFLGLFFLMPFNGYAAFLFDLFDKTYEWEGDVSDAWEVGSNWEASPGTEPGDQNYNIDGNSYKDSGDPTPGDDPVISSSTSFGYTIEKIFVTNDAILSISDNTLTVIDEILMARGGVFIINSGAIVNVDRIVLIDANTAIRVEGGTLIANEIIMGKDDPYDTDGDNGSPSLTLSSGSITCSEIMFSAVTDDTPKIIISGGNMTVLNDISSVDTGIADISVSGSATLDINGNLIMDGGSDIFTMSGNSIVNLAGDWTNQGTNNMSGGTITMDGIVGQTFNSSSSSGATFYDLELPNATGITLSTPVRVLNSLTFNGIISTDWTNTLKLSSGATFTQSTPLSYINGPFFKSGTEAFTFPLIRPISISAPSSDTEFAAEYIGSSPAGSYSLQSREEAIDHVSSIEYWILNRTSGSSGVAVTLHWDSGSDVGEAEDLGDLLVARWDGSQWVSHGGGASGTPSSGTITSGTVSSFSPFTFASSSEEHTLPVTLTDFKAKLQVNGNVHLTWETATETNNSHFEIQRSKDGEEFETIAKIYSQEESGNSNKPLYYSTTDYRPMAGTSYYRLKQLDFDGTYKIYPFAVIQNEIENTTYKVVYPNPILNNEVFVRIEGEFDSADFSLLDSQGMPIHSKTTQDEENTFQIIPTSTLGAGYYFLKINVINKGKVEASSHKLIVK